MKIKEIFIKHITVGLIFFIAFNTTIKLILYPFICYLMPSFLLDIIIMFSASYILRRILILIYDFLKIDWLSIEGFKYKQKNGKNYILVFINKYKKYGDIMLSLVLIVTDPVIFVLYFRKESFRWDRINNYKMEIFFILSNLICVSFMAGVFGLLLELFKNWL
jgi:hypothetical protein